MDLKHKFGMTILMMMILRMRMMMMIFFTQNLLDKIFLFCAFNLEYLKFLSTKVSETTPGQGWGGIQSNENV